MENYDKEMEKKLLDMVKQKQQADKRLLRAEVFIGITATVVLLALVYLAAFVQMANGLRIALIAIGFVLFLAGCFYALRLEQVAGYYVCAECGHRYVPTYKAVSMAQHMGRNRKMKCPECGRKSWQKKVLTKE